MPRKDAAYYREYRAKKKQAETSPLLDAAATGLSSATDMYIGKVHLKADPKGNVVVDVKKDGTFTVKPKTDRQQGLPRSNYYSDPKQRGGWTEVIQGVDPHLADRILNHPAIRTKR
jgi:hypothetical protein